MTTAKIDKIASKAVNRWHEYRYQQAYGTQCGGTAFDVVTDGEALHKIIRAAIDEAVKLVIAAVLAPDYTPRACRCGDGTCEACGVSGYLDEALAAFAPDATTDGSGSKDA